MMKIKLLLFMHFFAFFNASCQFNRTMTIDEFKQKYDWDEVVIKHSGKRWAVRGESYEYNFNYLGVSYGIGSSFNFASKGDEFYALIDKKKPDKNYLILWGKPCLPKNGYFIGKGILRKVSSYNQNFAIVRYEYTIENYSDNVIRKRTELIPNAYFEKMLNIKEENKEIQINLHIISVDLKTSNYQIQPFICLKCLD